ncbi:pentapeptide repeat-containing protein [Dolichospermum sp. ST_sed9]|nr:pentapeptide repeat-containing protein [Dolichospermum sp. ST_sed9]
MLITGEGQDKNFDRQDLRGVNLQTAILTDASFIGADLSEANLQDADLSRAKLVQTQLDSTDFTGTTLTGAYIQDWGITNDTKFNGVRCEYVYMRLPTKENPDPLRKPDNNKEVFADGDFGDFIKPIFDTLDLYHNQGVDPRAIAISFKELAENHPEAELEIVAMEKRGEDKFLLRAKTAVTANKSELSNEYFNTYNQVKGLPEREIQLLLAEKDSQIRRLENMVITALERPSFYAQTYQNQGVTKMSESYQSKYDQRNANIQFVDTAQSGSNVTFNQTNYTPEQKQSLAEAAAEIQNLLKQLEETNPTATESEQIAHLKDNTTLNLRKRALSALQGGTETAIDEFILENKLLKVGKAVIEGWLQPDK